MASWDESEIECKLFLSDNVLDGTAKCWTALPQVEWTKQVQQGAAHKSADRMQVFVL